MESPSAKKIMLRMLLILKVNLTRGDIDIVHRLNTKKQNQNNCVITTQKVNFLKPGQIY